MKKNSNDKNIEKFHLYFFLRIIIYILFILKIRSRRRNSMNGKDQAQRNETKMKHRDLCS